MHLLDHLMSAGDIVGDDAVVEFLHDGSATISFALQTSDEALQTVELAFKSIDMKYFVVLAHDLANWACKERRPSISRILDDYREHLGVPRVNIEDRSEVLVAFSS
jgi:hypothetical protein